MIPGWAVAVICVAVAALVLIAVRWYDRRTAATAQQSVIDAAVARQQLQTENREVLDRVDTAHPAESGRALANRIANDANAEWTKRDK